MALIFCFSARKTFRFFANILWQAFSRTTQRWNDSYYMSHGVNEITTRCGQIYEQVGFGECTFPRVLSHLRVFTESSSFEKYFLTVERINVKCFFPILERGWQIRRKKTSRRQAYVEGRNSFKFRYLPDEGDFESVLDEKKKRRNKI